MRSSTVAGLLALSVLSNALPGTSAARACSGQSIDNMKQKIKNVLILEMENRSLDNLLGGQTIEGLENPINNGPFCNPLNVSQPNQGYACTGASDYDEILDVSSRERHINLSQLEHLLIRSLHIRTLTMPSMETTSSGMENSSLTTMPSNLEHWSQRCTVSVMSRSAFTMPKRTRACLHTRSCITIPRNRCRC